MAQINKPNTYFNTATYTGTGSAQSITTGFQPDWTWTKIRNTTGNHREQDSVRGTGSELYPNLTNAEATGVTQAITSWTSTGYNIGTDTGINNSGSSYVSWNWLAGGTAVSNTDGSITSSVSANTTSGFSIVSYTSDGNSGATVGHGLGVAPSVVIVKRRSSIEDWGVGHQSLGWTKFIRLNTTGAEATATGLWNDTAPSSTVVTLGNSGISNVGSGTTMIMYCFAEKKGFSKFGSYIGNGSNDGSYIYLGFKPAWVLIKKSSASGDNWHTWDSIRDTYNVVNKRLVPNSSVQEYNDFNVLDFCSNGFKLRDGSTYWNASGATFIYMAFAESPLVGTNNIPATAR